MEQKYSKELLEEYYKLTSTIANYRFKSYPYTEYEKEEHKTNKNGPHAYNQNIANGDAGTYDRTLTETNQANEKNVDKYSFRERFNFSIPIGVNVKINEKVSIEPYWLVGFNVAQANVIQNNSSTRLTKVGFTTGFGTRVLFCKELFFVGLEYRFAQNTFERTKIQSHNINLSVGVRFNLSTLANLIK